MRVLTWIIIGVVILANIGLGWRSLFPDSVGGQKVGESATVQNFTGEAKDGPKDVIDNSDK